jgi:hypothetical protein
LARTFVCSARRCSPKPSSSLTRWKRVHNGTGLTIKDMMSFWGKHGFKQVKRVSEPAIAGAPKTCVLVRRLAHRLAPFTPFAGTPFRLTTSQDFSAGRHVRAADSELVCSRRTPFPLHLPLTTSETAPGVQTGMGKGRVFLCDEYCGNLKSMAEHPAWRMM